MKKNFRTYNLAVQFYQSCQQLTLRGDARSQLDRAARSVALNLAEGSGRSRGKDQKRFYTIAFASLRECQASLELEQIDNPDLIAFADKLGAHLYCLLRES